MRLLFVFRVIEEQSHSQESWTESGGGIRCGKTGCDVLFFFLANRLAAMPKAPAVSFCLGLVAIFVEDAFVGLVPRDCCWANNEVWAEGYD